MQRSQVLALDDVTTSHQQIHISWHVDDMPFVTDIWYRDVDLDAVRAKVGEDVWHDLLLHIALFDINKGLSFAPTTLEVAKAFQPYLTEQLFQRWSTINAHIWGQWRYEHDLADYTGPQPAAPFGQHTPRPVALPLAEVAHLWLCGGGKDSLLTSELLNRSGLPYDSLGFSYSIYGAHDHQHGILSRLVERTRARTRLVGVVNDTALGLPVDMLGVQEGVDYVLAGETPSSLFASLPLVFDRGYTTLVLGHERSANLPNMRWAVTGEDINHQWGKSLEAERMLSEQVRLHFADVDYVSALQPVRDPLIFFGLNHRLDDVPVTHSCNIRKPWCKECAKCLYVWISYCAWLPLEVVEQTFGPDNLLDNPVNREWVEQLLGLGAHTPFECVGQPDESHLAFRMARAKGVGGDLMALLDKAPPRDLGADLDELLRVEDVEHRLTGVLAETVLETFRADAVRARAYVAEVLG